MGHEPSLAYEPWPEADADLLVEDVMTLIVQINGKKRGEIAVSQGASNEEIEALAIQSERVQAHLAGRAPKKVIVVPGRLVNVVG